MSQVQHIELTDRVYLEIKGMILKGELEPGQKLLQEKLSAQLGISRTPLLKALQMLEHDMLVESIPRRGMFVKKISPTEMVHVFEIREVLEGMAARLATKHITSQNIDFFNSLFEPFRTNLDDSHLKSYEKADQQFHAKIIELSGNIVLPKISLIDNIQYFAYQMGLLRPPQDTLEEHFEIIKAFENGDGAAAEQAMIANIRNSRIKFEQKLHNEA